MSDDNIRRWHCDCEFINPDWTADKVEVVRYADHLAVVAELRAEVERLRAALQKIQGWDCLNPPRPDLLGDLPWLRQLVDAALQGDQS